MSSRLKKADKKIARVLAMKRTLCLLMLLSFTASVETVRADIYRLDNGDETISFTDSPRDKRFQLVMKEQAVKQVKTGNYREKRSKTGQEAAATQLHADAGSNAGNLPVQGRITSLTGLRSDPIDGKLRHHNGLDIATPTGTPVKPVAAGTVLFSGWKPGYGNTVILDHLDGMTTVYAHHADNSVSAGALVDRDTVIAHTGSTGRSTGPHLHFEAWRFGVNITPDFMPGHMAVHRIARNASPPINRYLQADGTIIFTNLR